MGLQVRLGAPRAQVKGMKGCVLEGSWDLVTIYNWGYNPTYNWVTPIRPFRGVISRVISPVISSY